MNPDGENVIVREVWSSNIHSEMSLIGSILPSCSFASFDTEFPGTIFTPDVDKGSYSKLSPSTNYSFMKANVDALNIIQLGLTLTDSDGNLPHFGTQNGHVWQFNFSDFDVEKDLHNVESIRLLQKQGIDFSRCRKEGVPTWLFRNLLSKSGLLFNPRLTWVTFHSPYDFGFLVKLITWRRLPLDVYSFKPLVAQIFGPRIYDVKHVIKFCQGLYGGLDSVSKTLKVDRAVGKTHQAGSDSLLTLQTFMKLEDVYFSGNSALEAFQGALHSLEVKCVEPIILVPAHVLERHD